MTRTGKTLDFGQQLTSINRQFEEQRTQTEAKRLGLEYIDLASVTINPDMLLLVTEEQARLAEVMPFYRVGQKLRLAVRDPNNAQTELLCELLRAKGFKINLTLSSWSGLQHAWELYAQKLIRGADDVKSVIAHQETVGTYEEEIKTLNEFREEIKSANAADAVMTILTGALRTGASDLHLQPYPDHLMLRLRIDGVLQDVLEFDIDKARLIVEQIKHLAHMKVNVWRQPQDGRFAFTVEGHEVDARVSSLPTVEGETIVIRLLDNTRQLLGLDALGLRGTALDHVIRAVREPHGMVLAAGPTGSGKTTTLYSLLGLINTPQKKVITLEDPVEYRVAGISQSQVSIEEDYTFAKGLRAILRQDPDIVMVGEIRDLETAEIAAQAAMTGHIVLSTLHTNDAVTAIPRLVNMGLKPYIVAPALGVVIAQRLVRRVCASCAVDHEVSSAEQRTIADCALSLADMDTTITVPARVRSVVGCDVCSHTGYHGQIGIYEVLRITDTMRQMILDEKSVADLQIAARQGGMRSMREDGILKVLDGITTVAEVMRATGSL